MEIGGLYQFVLLLVLVGMLTGAGLVALTNFGTATGVAGTPAQTAINNTVAAIATIPSTWLPLIVTISAIAIIIVLVVRSFGGGGQR
jgi:hypothetical protein